MGKTIPPRPPKNGTYHEGSTSRPQKGYTFRGNPNPRKLVMWKWPRKDRINFWIGLAIGLIIGIIL